MIEIVLLLPLFLLAMLIMKVVRDEYRRFKGDPVKPWFSKWPLKPVKPVTIQVHCSETHWSKEQIVYMMESFIIQFGCEKCKAPYEAKRELK